MSIHPTTIIEPGAIIGKNVKIGPFCVIGAEVVIQDNVELKSHVVIEGLTEIGEGTIIYPFASLGQPPQILKYQGEKAKTIIGKNNKIREYVTIQSGSAGGGMLTKIGDDCLLMVGVHIGHDCKVGNGIVMANYVSLAGHVEVGDFAVIGGLAAVHQYVRVGAYSMIGGVSALVRDLIPFGTAVGDRASLEGVNIVGMKRKEFSSEEITNTKNALDYIFTAEGVMEERINQTAKKFAGNKAIEQIIEFMQLHTTRQFCQPKK